MPNKMVTVVPLVIPETIQRFHELASRGLQDKTWGNVIGFDLDPDDQNQAQTILADAEALYLVYRGKDAQ